MGMKKELKRYLRHKATPGRMEKVMRFVPRSLVTAGQTANLKNQVAWVAEYSDFYKKKFSELGIDPGKVKRIEDLKGLWTTPRDVLEQGEAMCCVPPQMAFESTGTSGKNKRIFFVNKEINRATSYICSSFSMYGLTPADRFLNFYDFSLWMTGFLHQKACEKFEAFCLPVGKTAPEKLYQLIETYRITALVGYGSQLMRLTEIAEEHGAPRMRAILVGGERMPPHIRKWIESVWRCKVYIGYGCTESCGGIAAECARQNGFHIDELNCVIEIENPDKDGFGEIIVTTLGRTCMPLLRYRLGDVGRIETAPCQCGMPMSRIMEISGRLDEKVSIGGWDFYPTVFEEIVAAVPQLGKDFQLTALYEDRREVLELAVETDAPPEDIELAVKAALQKCDPYMCENVSLGILQLRIRCEKPHTIRKGIKLKRFVDLRNNHQYQSK